METSRDIWRLTITWKAIVLGFHNDNDIHTVMLNNMLSFVFLQLMNLKKMKCRFNNESCQKETLYKNFFWLQIDILILRRNLDVIIKCLLT